MTSKRDTRNQKMSASRSEETASKRDACSTSKNASLTESSPPILEPSMDESGIYRRPSIREKTIALLLRSSPSETDPIVSGGQPNEHLSEQQVNVQDEDSGSNCCTSFINCYTTYVTRLRNSDFMYIVLLLFSSIPISAIVMGVLFGESCRKAQYLPLLGAIVGVVGAMIIAAWLFTSCSDYRGRPCSNGQALLGVFFFAKLMALTIIDAVLVFSLSPSFDSAFPDYCNETFYTYAFYKEIATAVAVVLLALLYIPGSLHTLCCQESSRPSTPSGSYDSI